MNVGKNITRSSGAGLHGGGGAVAEREQTPSAAWVRMIKLVIGRFARGNINAQEGRILLPEEQEAERRLTKPIARKWKERYKVAS